MEALRVYPRISFDIRSPYQYFSVARCSYEGFWHEVKFIVTDGDNQGRIQKQNLEKCVARKFCKGAQVCAFHTIPQQFRVLSDCR